MRIIIHTGLPFRLSVSPDNQRALLDDLTRALLVPPIYVIIELIPRIVEDRIRRIIK